MTKLSTYAAIFLMLVYSSCSQTTKYSAPVADGKTLEKNFTTFWKYYNTYVQLSGDYIALDTAFNIIPKEGFLKQLKTGAYLPLKLTYKDSTCYQLYKIDAAADAGISPVVKEMAEFEYQNFKLEGKPLQGFNYTDIAGNIYSPQTTRDKIVVMKCWFIHCQKCNEERPALNNLVNIYKSRKDVVFVSLAFDTKEELQQHITKTTINYPVASVKQEYFIDTLGITVFPTYLVINKKGLVSKVVNSYAEMEPALKKVAME